jgi:polyhydroxybutyrate depolymerase
MRKVAWVVAVLGIAGCGFLHPAGASATPSGTGSRSGSASSTASKKIVNVATSTRTYSLTAGGLERSYVVIAPVSGLPASAPVIVMLSGDGAPVSAEATRDQLVPYASSDQAEIVYPVAVKATWNSVDCCGYAHRHGVDDLAFMKALVPAVDPGHARPVYVAGYSNGARLAYRVACTDPGLFDAYAAVKGLPSPGCLPSKPVTIAQLASLDDPESRYKPGGKTTLDDPIPVITLVARLRAADNCPASPVVTHTGSMTLDTWPGCAAGVRLVFATWTDGKHSYPRPPYSVPAAAQVIWSFFTNTPLAPPP